MIKVNGQHLSGKRFPAGEYALSLRVVPNSPYIVEWLYDGDEELFQLIALSEHIKEHGGLLDALIMPYCPNARMDRVKTRDEVFTLKYFIRIIDGLGFSAVYINNPHSDVCMTINGACKDFPKVTPTGKLITEGRVGYCWRPVRSIVEKLNREVPGGFNSGNSVIFYPDSGAAKRYESEITFPYLWGNKVRNWKTRDIERYDIIGNAPGGPFNVLIVDDICGYGSTVYYAALELVKLGAVNIYVYVTHLENTFWDGRHPNGAADGRNLFDSVPEIRKIFTTHSIYMGETGDRVGYVD